MSKLSKVLVTIVLIVLYFIIYTIIYVVRQAMGYHTPGFISVIILIALIFAIRAVWKKDKSGNDDSNSPTLQ